MVKNQITKNYMKIGIVAAAALGGAILATVGIKLIGGGSGSSSFDDNYAPVAAASASDLRIAVLRMDVIQQQAKVLADLRKQREKYEGELKSAFEKTQKALEKEKTEIESQQDVLSREALQKRVVEYQQKIANFQRGVTEKAQAIEASFQKALTEIQERYLDGIVGNIIDRNQITMVLDGRIVRLSTAAGKSLDITGDVVSALDKKITKFTMDKPKGL